MRALGRFLWLVSASLAGCLPSGSGGALASPAPSLREDVLAWISWLDECGHHLEMRGDHVIVPKAFDRLVALGPGAVPTLLHVAAATDDEWERGLLLDIVARIGDPAAREALEGFLSSTFPGARSAALDAVGRLGCAESLPILRQVLERWPASERMAVLEAMYRVGDHDVIAEALRIGLADNERRFDAAQLLLRHEPLRKALGIEQPFREGEWDFVDDALFLPAADEWYRETVLGQTSPWRSVLGEALAPPFLAAKQEALQRLVDRIRSGNALGNELRVRAEDPIATDDDGRRLVWLVTGEGHQGGLSIQAWTAEVDAMVCHEFELAWVPARTRFPEDHTSVVCRRISLPMARYRELIVGLRTVLEAELVPWWSGPDSWIACSSCNFVVSLGGVDAPGAPRQRFCGYEGSFERVRYEKLRAAARWHREFVARHGAAAPVGVTPEAKRCFSAIFLAELPAWTADDWWVMDRMVAMARDLGDASLLAPLAQMVEPSSSPPSPSRQRLVAAAVNALAAISDVDARFHPDGTPRSVGDVAAIYHQRFAR